MLRKGMTLAVIFLFISVSVIPSTGNIVSFDDDTTPPVTTCTLDPPEPDGDNGWYVNDVNVTLNATDDMSGVNATYYRIGSGAWYIYTEQFGFYEANFIIEYYSVDNAGNEEEVSCTTIDGYTHSDIETTENIVWDNGLDSHWAIASQYGSNWGEIGLAADDFLFENDIKVMGVKWIGAYWGGEDSDFDMEIIFYYNRSEGNMPGDIYAGPFFYPNEETNETHMEKNFFSYNVSLPQPIFFPGGEKYWVSIQSIADIFPQWGMGAHETPQRLATFCWKGEYFGVFDWIPSEEVYVGFFLDLSFQLTGEENLPPNAPTITGEIEGKVGKEYEYTFNAIDPTGDDVFYEINWGDGIVDPWDGPHESNKIIIRNHTWEEQGTYRIMARAKDVYGAIGEWGALVVTMPKNQNLWFYRWLDRFPLLNRLQSLPIFNRLFFG